MIDRPARQKLAEALRSFLNEESDSAQFEEDTLSVADNTEDEAARHIAYELWSFYDDFVEHLVASDKRGWDYAHRLLLALESDKELAIDTSKRWTIRQAVAGVAFVGFVVIALLMGSGEHLIYLSFPFGVISMLLTYWDRKTAPELSQRDKALTPFSSFREMLHVRRQIPAFSKRPFPVTVKDRRLRTPFVEKIMMLPTMMLWMLIGPLALFFQMFPETITELRLQTS